MKKGLFLLVLLFPVIVFAEKINSEKIADINTLYLLDFVMDSNNNYYLAGGNEEGHLFKYNANKELVIRKTLEDFSYCYSVYVDNNDNIYALCTKTEVFESSEVQYLPNINKYPQSYIIKLTNNFEIVFAKTFVGTKDISSIGQIFVKDNYIYYLSPEMIFGNYLRTEDNDAYYKYDFTNYLYKLDLNGNLVSKKAVSETLERERSFMVTRPSSWGSGSIVAPSRNILMEADVFYYAWAGTGRVYKCDYNGNVIWSTKIDNANSIRFITKTNDGNFLISGSRLENSATKPYMAIIDSDGHLIKEIPINASGKGTVDNIINADHGYYALFHVTSGTIEEINSNQTGYYVVKFDYNFNVKDKVKLPNYYPWLFKEKAGVYGSVDYRTLYKFESDFTEDLAKDKVIKITEKIDLKTLFDVDLSEANWSIDDTSILKIENKEIIPLKVGTTTITTRIDNIDYLVNITVEAVPNKEEEEDEQEEQKPNPETIDIVLIAGLLFITSLIVFTILVKKKKKFGL